MEPLESHTNHSPWHRGATEGVALVVGLALAGRRPPVSFAVFTSRTPGRGPVELLEYGPVQAEVGMTLPW